MNPHKEHVLDDICMCLKLVSAGHVTQTTDTIRSYSEVTRETACIALIMAA